MKVLTVLVLVLGQVYTQGPRFDYDYGKVVLRDNVLEIAHKEPLKLDYVLVTSDGGAAWVDFGNYVGYQENRRRFRAVESPTVAVEILHGLEESVFIGLWKLDDKNRVDLKYEQIEHEKEIRVEKEAWTDHRWSVGR